MNQIRISSLTRVRPMLLALALATTSVAGARDLVSDSPFLPEGFTPSGEREQRPPPPPPQPPRGPQPLDNIEFRGLTKVGGELAFSLYDPAEQRSFWLGPGESFAGFTITEFEEGGDYSIVVSHNGETRTIGLREAEVQPLEVPRETNRNDRRRGRNENADPRSTEERMEELAAEIRRRREARRELLEQAEQRNNN